MVEWNALCAAALLDILDMQHIQLAVLHRLRLPHSSALSRRRYVQLQQ